MLLVMGSINLTAQQERPKIGLALSGGGARGMAHVGVLKVLEEAGIRPDYITGVSMGSIVAGLYAMGYPADSIEQFFLKQDWGKVLNDQIAENNVAFEEKRNFRNQLLSLYEVNGKWIPSDGLIKGQHISALLNYFTWPAMAIESFDSLGIPYKAVAADVVSCKPVLLENGSLAETMRASMAVPTVFSPIELDGKLMVDGGLVKNFAIDELKAMGADIIIGSYTGRRMLEKEELKSITSILAQITSFSGLEDAEEQKQGVDILINHDFGTITPADFGKADSMMIIGYNSALPFLDQFKALADSVDNQPEKINYPQINKLKIDSIAVSGNKIVSNYQIRNILDVKQGDLVSRDYLEERVNLLYGLFMFKKISYDILNENQKTVLLVKCEEKPRNFMNLSPHFDTYLNFGVNASFIYRNWLVDNSRFTVDAFISKFYRFRGEYALFWGKNNQWNSKFGMLFTKDELPAYLTDEYHKVYNNFEYNLSFGLNYQPGNNSSIGFGMDYERVSFKPIIYSATGLRKSRFKNFNFNLSYKLNTLDNYYLPRKGSDLSIELSNVNLLRARYEYLETEENYNWNNPGKLFFEGYYRLLLKSRFFIPVAKKWTATLRLNAIITTDESFADNDYALIGGPEIYHKRGLPFYGFHANQFVTKSALGAGAGLYYWFSEKLNLGFLMDTYYIENIKIDQLFVTNYGYGLELGYLSRLGPVKWGVMNNGLFAGQERLKKLKMYVSIGFKF